MSRDSDAAIERDEVITHITAPPPAQIVGTAYHKQTERESYDWPIFDVAVVLALAGATVESISIVLGGVAPTPLRAKASEALIKGRQVTEALAREAARIAVSPATPYACNAYKVGMLEVVLRRTLLQAARQ
jgi:xanthine dehydrogenase YagS FAD-binding subunit